MTIRKHHLDRRAKSISEQEDGDPQDLLSTEELARWLGVSEQFLEIGRSKGYGPRYVRLSPRRIRYRRDDVRNWLRERTHQNTAEYERKLERA